MADAFVDDQTGGAVAQTSAKTINMCDRVEREWVDLRGCLVQADELLWKLNRQLLIRKMLQ